MAKKKRGEAVRQRIEVEGLTLPYHQNIPTACSQQTLVACIPFDVFLEFTSPIGSTSLWRRRSIAASMPMPEAPVNKDGLPQSRKDQVWCSW